MSSNLNGRRNCDVALWCTVSMSLLILGVPMSSSDLVDIIYFFMSIDEANK